MREVVGIYCRLSEEDKDKRNKGDESESIQNQKSILITYACERGWDIYNIYSDEDYSGSDRNRPQFNQMLKDAEEGKINIVLCKSQSRFSRELEIIEKYIHGYFLLWGTRFVSVVDNADSSRRENKKARQINGLINEWYLEDLSDSIKSVLDDKRSKGLHIGSSVVYGYKKDPDHKGHIIIDEPAAEIVREIFRMYVSGIGKTEITRILNRKKIPNPAQYKYENDLHWKKPTGKCGMLWGYPAVVRILKNEMYIGNMLQGTTGTISYKSKKKRNKPQEEWYLVENTHEPIIEKEVWDKAQVLLKRASRPKKDGKVGIFSGKARCASCGYMLHLDLVGGRRYLKCGTPSRLKEACTGSFIPEKHLKEYVLGEFQKMIALYLDRDYAEGLVSLPIERENRKGKLKAEIGALEKKRANTEVAIKELYLDKVKGDITLEEYRILSKELSDDIHSYKESIRERSAELLQMDEGETEKLTQREILEKYINIKELSYDIMNTFIDHIEVGHRKTRHEEYPIKIFWNF